MFCQLCTKPSHLGAKLRVAIGDVYICCDCIEMIHNQMQLAKAKENNHAE